MIVSRLIGGNVAIKKHNRVLKGMLLWSIPLLFLVNNVIYCIEYELTPLKLSFFGAINAKNNIIVYGDFGTYLFSSDLGRTWEQKNIGLYDEIRSIVNHNDTLFGVTLNGYLILSIDNGNSWKHKKIQVEVRDKFLKILVTDEGIYLRGIETLVKLDRNGDIMRFLKDAHFRPSHIKALEGNPDEVVAKVDEYFADNVYLYGDKIILNSEVFCDSGFIIVEPNLESFSKIYLPKKFTERGKEYGCPGIIKVHSYKNRKIFQFKFNLFEADTFFTRFNSFFVDSSFMNFNSPYELHKQWFSYGNPQLYFTVGDTLFIGMWRDSVKYDTLLITDSSLQRKPYYQFNIYSVKKYIFAGKDTFVVQGNPFYDVYNGYIVIYGDLIANTLYHRIETPSLVLNDSIWIYTNRNRFLLMTTDKGYSWRLISYLSGVPRVILNDTTYFFVLQGKEITEVNRTIDGGTTFLPSKNYVEGYETRRPIYCFNSVPIFYIDSTGCGFLRGDYKTENCDRIYYTYNFWDTYSYIPGYPDPDSLRSKRYIPPCETANIVKFDNCYLIATSCQANNLPGRPYYSSFRVLDTSYTQAIRPGWIIDWCKILHIMPTGVVNKFIYFCLVQDSTSPGKEWFEIRSTTDTGKTYTTLHIIDDFEGEILQFYQHNADSVFFTTSLPDRLYLYDRKSNELKVLWGNEESFYYPLLMVISDRFYLVGRELFLENTDRNDLTQWREGKWDYGKPNFESVIFKGNVAIAGMSDSLRPFNYYKITLKKDVPTSVGDTKVEIPYYTTHFYATEPYPMPARNVVKSKIYTDGSFELNEAIEGVYDGMGNKIEGRERIRIRELGKASAEIVWECNGLASGVYFIVVRHGGRVGVIPVMVE